MENKIAKSPETSFAALIAASHAEAPVRNPYKSEVASGMYIQLGRTVREASRARAMRDGIKVGAWFSTLFV